MILESRNLILRDTIFEDCSKFSQWEDRNDVKEYFIISDDHGYRDIVRDFFNCEKDQSMKMYTITLKPDGKPIGRIILSRINKESDSLDLTKIYIADKNMRNKGYGEEAIRLILENSFINLHMERVTIDHFVENEVARHLYHKIGFRDEGIMRHSGKKNGRYYDLALMSMLRSEYYDKLHGKL